MATFTVDLLTGDIYLFNGDFTGSGGSTPTSGSTYPEVNLYSNLPAPILHSGEIYVVRTGSGDYILNRKDAGLYFSTGAVWRRLGDTPSYFKSDNFEVYDSIDNTKGVKFVTSGITSSLFRELKIQDSDGTIAYLTDLDAKVNVSAFADYTGNTAPNTYLSISDFDTYSGQTYTLIQGKQDTLTAGAGIDITNNVISTNVYKPLQITDTSGGVSVNNIQSVSIIWDNIIFTGTSLNFTGGSRIYIEDNGVYGISYNLNLMNTNNTLKNIGSIIRKNGNIDITPMSSASVNFDSINDSSSNNISEYFVTLVDGDYIELDVFRIGNSGTIYTVENGSWMKIIRKE